MYGTSDSDAGAAPAPRTWRRLSARERNQAVPESKYAAIALVFLAIVFNAVLAIINAHAVALSPSTVIACEVAIVAAAHLVILRNFQASMFPWYGMMLAIIVFAMIRAAVVGHFEPKYARDMLLIPTFVMLGMTVPTERIKVLIVTLHCVVVAGVLFEAIATDLYSTLFAVRDYYIATRSFDDSAFWNSSSDLFVSATRPDERFFNFVDLHRVSSVFLEPVTLGNYVIIITIYLIAFYRSLGWKLWTLILIGNVIVLVGCDGRLATISSVIIIGISFVAPLLPRKSALFYLPVALIGAVVLATATGANPRDDNFTGRIAYCIKLLSNYDIPDWFGISDQFVGPAADSGIAYMITTQSIIGLLLFWIVLVSTASEQRIEQIKSLHAICVFAVLTLLISYSLFSIKTAALLWFIHGSLQHARVQAAVPAIMRRSRRRSDPRIGGAHTHPAQA